MRIDFEARTIHCSVGDLVQVPTYRRIGVERGDGFRRMWIGQEVHSRRAEERSSEDERYRPEVSVSHQAELNGWTVIVSGRIDGVTIDREKKHLVIEEVKSLHFDLELQALYRSEKLQRHLFQLMLYAYFLSLQPEYEEYSFEPQLVLIDILTFSQEIIPAPLNHDDIASAFDGAVFRLVEETDTALALRGAKQAFADTMQFPFERMRPFQNEMVESVTRSIRQRETLLVSAPTGIGKTMAAIFPALRESLRTGKKLFYLTSKTLQQEMAVDALKLLNDGSFRVLRVRSKQKMCAHTQVICHEDFCPFAARYTDKMERSNLLGRMVDQQSYFDPDVTYEMARSEEVCPFEVSLELIEQADVVICDYNYIFDPYVGLKAYQQDNDFGDCILVIDEAHNLIDRGRNYYSPELSEATIDTVSHHLAMRPQCVLDGWEDLVDELKTHLRELSESLEIHLSPSGGDQRGFPAEPLRVGLCEPSRRLFQRQRNEWERLIIQYIGWKIENRIAEEKDPVVDFYFKLVKLNNMLADDGEEFAHLIERTREGCKLKVFCKDPSRFLGEIIRSAHAVIAMSATLEPFEFFRNTLGFPSDRTSELSLPSPFPRENRKIVIIPEVDTTWKERSQHYAGIGEMVSRMADAAGGNFLALFPSYAFLNEVATRMPMIDKRISIQRSDMTDYEKQNLLELLREPGSDGNLILAVAGGMYAEGIDYQGEMLSGVFVVGPALPPVSFEQELLKRHYDELYGRGFEYAYLIPGMTRVVQSAGRVIRSERDIGVIALLCRRFTSESYTKFFPSDWYENSPRELVSKKPAEAIRAFFEEKRSPQLRMRLV